MPARHAAGPLARIVIAAAGVIAVVAVLNSDRGVPHALLMLVAFVAGAASEHLLAQPRQVPA